MGTISNSNQIWKVKDAYQKTLDSAWTTTKGNRSIIGGGNDPASNIIEFNNIPTRANSTDFGDLTGNSGSGCYGSSNSVRGVFNCVGPGTTKTIDTITILTTGNATDFGDLTVARGNGAAYGSNTRGIFHCGNDGSSPATNHIDYIQFATLGNAADFGDSTTVRRIKNGSTKYS